MTDAYHNMSVPPRTRVQRTVKTVGWHIVFDLALVAGLPEKREGEILTAWFDDFCRDNAAALEAAPRPVGYSMATPLPRDKPLPDGFRLCVDPVLTVAVLGRVAGGLYIPRRELRLNPDLADRLYAFPARDFPPEAMGEPSK